MSNPFLKRLADQGSIGHGRKSEKRAAKNLGARLTPNSGAKQGAKSDASTADFRFEMKSTIARTMSLEAGWLSKIGREALPHGQHPAVVIAFVDSEGKPIFTRYAEWVMIPVETFKEITGADHVGK